MENRNLRFFKFYQIAESGYLLFLFFQIKASFTMKFVKKDIPPFLKLNVLPITFVVSFNDVLSLQFTMYVITPYVYLYL
jgi:hypothetical protein